MAKRADAGKPQRKKPEVGVAFDPVGAALRQMHDKVTQEDIPDDFLRLLDEIDSRAKGGAQ